VSGSSKGLFFFPAGCQPYFIGDMLVGIVYVIEIHSVKAIGETLFWKSFLFNTWLVSITEIVI